MTAFRFSGALLAGAVLMVGCGSGEARRTAQQEMRDALDGTVRQRQAEYFERHGTYASHADSLGLAELLPRGVRIRVSGGDANGWSAAANHVSLPSAPCTLFVGTPPQYAALPALGQERAASVGTEGVVQCAGADG